MSRPSRRLALVALLAAAGCQDYRFNPVGKCVVQPGAARVTLSNISTADVLFVVDDSGSMAGEQANLATSFKSFIERLDQFNADRAKTEAGPIDFHIAITTTSVFLDNPSTAYCKASCPGVDAAAGKVCCRVEGGSKIGALTTAKKCSGEADQTCGTGNACTLGCPGWLGEYVCCTAGNQPVGGVVACDTLEAPCGDLQTHYAADENCTLGNAVDGGYFPHGSFVGKAGNPFVLHFDKSLYPAATAPCAVAGNCVNAQGFTAAELRTFFAENVVAGTCGSGQEQGFQASTLAIEKARLGKQLDNYPVDSRTPAQALAAWLHPTSKLVVVYVGDEDDCSNPESASQGVIMTSNKPGPTDSCVVDQSLPADQQRETKLDAVVGYFTGLKLADGTKRPVGVAFVVSTNGSCVDEACTAGICCDTACTGSASVCSNATCGGQGPGKRFLRAAELFRQANIDVVAGSICDPFGPTLARIADIVKPPTALILPTEPATTDIAVLRIVGANGKTRKTCGRPAPIDATWDAANGIASDPEGKPYDWWFTATAKQDSPADRKPTAASKYVFLNHATDNCEAGPGETYSADYIGRLPAGGCFGATPAEADASCITALGGTGYSSDDAGDASFTCYAGVDGGGQCLRPTAQNPGTCICGGRGRLAASAQSPDPTGNCPVGSAF